MTQVALTKASFYPQALHNTDISGVYTPGNMFLATETHKDLVLSSGYRTQITPAMMINTFGPIKLEDVVTPLYKIKILPHDSSPEPVEFKWTQRLGTLYKILGTEFTAIICQGSSTTQNTLKSAIGGIKRITGAGSTSIRACAVYDHEDNTMYFAYAVCAVPVGISFIDGRNQKRCLYA